MKSLYADSVVKVNSIPILFMSFQSARSLQHHSVRSKLYPLEIASCRCKDSCCFASQNDVKEWDKFSSYITIEVLIQMITFITIISVCFIYIRSCKVCHKQNVGPNTVMIFKSFVFHWNNYKNCQCKTEKGKSIHKYKYKKLLSNEIPLKTFKLLSLIKAIHQILQEGKDIEGQS